MSAPINQCLSGASFTEINNVDIHLGDRVNISSDPSAMGDVFLSIYTRFNDRREFLCSTTQSGRGLDEVRSLLDCFYDQLWFTTHENKTRTQRAYVETNGLIQTGAHLICIKNFGESNFQDQRHR
jgi:hypothetical protein